jgi:hypothetical protein
MTDDNRQLGPEMIAEGWSVIGGDSIMWCSEPTRSVVVIEGPWKRSSYWASAPIAPNETIEPDDECYNVSKYHANDMGEPIQGEYDGFLTKSYAKAIIAARGARSEILEKQLSRIPKRTNQMSFDDLLEAKSYR